jgi:putative resolvase
MRSARRDRNTGDRTQGSVCALRLPWFERFCVEHETELLVLNAETLSPEAEMVQDLMTIVHCFSSRLYGLRNYKKSLRDGLK